MLKIHKTQIPKTSPKTNFSTQIRQLKKRFEKLKTKLRANLKINSIRIQRLQKKGNRHFFLPSFDDKNNFINYNIKKLVTFNPVIIFLKNINNV